MNKGWSRGVGGAEEWRNDEKRMRGSDVIVLNWNLVRHVATG